MDETDPTQPEASGSSSSDSARLPDGDEPVCKDAAFSQFCRDLRCPEDISAKALAIWAKLFCVVSDIQDFKVNPPEWYICVIYIASLDIREPYGLGDPNLQALERDSATMTVSQLISAAHVTMLTFFKKMRIVRELLPFSEPVSYRFRALERKYCVTSCLFYKFERLFPDLFREEHSAFLISGEKENVDTAELNTNRVKQWIWTLFLLAKDRALSCGHELITAFHLLLCACDHVIMSVPSFTLQSPFADTVVGRPSLEQPHTILEILAGQTNTTLEEILRVHVTYWQPFVCSVPHADVASLAQLYQKHYRRHGDFEETQFLEHNPLLMPKPSPPSPAGDAAAAQGALPPTPVRAALNTLQQLRSILAKSPTNPSEQLLAFFRNCSIDTSELIQCRARQMQEQFVNKFLTALPAVSGSSSLFEQTARQRYTVASSLYYRVMESMLRTEQERLATSDLTPLLCSDSFHRSLLACSVEVVLTVYGATSGALLGEHDLASEFSFPWVLDVFDLKPFHFVKVLESFIKAEPKLTSDVVKHLQNVENSILEQLAWQENSPVFDLLTHWAATSTSPLHQGDYPTQLFRSPIRPPGGTHLSPVSPSRRAGHSYSLALFLNKVCRLAHSRLQAMCKYLDIPTDVVQKIWTCLEHVVTQKSDLLRDRHLDQMMMCSVYAICKVLCEREVKFKTIVSAYGRMPHTSQGVYRKVVITGSSTHSIITFYNTIFMQAMKNHILQYSTTRGQPASPGSGNGEKVTVSPHTPSQRLLASPMYSVPGHRNFYVSPMSDSPFKIPESPTMTPNRKMQIYSLHVGEGIGSSEKMRVINEAMRASPSPTLARRPQPGGAAGRTPKSQKRLQFDQLDEEPTMKQAAPMETSDASAVPATSILSRRLAANASERKGLAPAPCPDNARR